MKYVVASIIKKNETVEQYVVCDFCSNAVCPHVLMTPCELNDEVLKNFKETDKTGYGNVYIEQGYAMPTHKCMTKIMIDSEGRYRFVRTDTGYMETYGTLAYIDEEHMRIIGVNIDKNKITCSNEVYKNDESARQRIANADINGRKVYLFGSIDTVEEHQAVDYISMNKSLAMMGIKGMFIDSMGTAIVHGREFDSDIIVPDGATGVYGATVEDIEVRSLILPKTVKEVATRFMNVDFGYVNLGGAEIIRSGSFCDCTIDNIEGFENIKLIESGAIYEMKICRALDLSMIKGTICDDAISGYHKYKGDTLILPKEAEAVKIVWGGKVIYK